VNRWKGNQPAHHVRDILLRKHSRLLNRPLSEEELDVIEYVIYGDIMRPDGTRVSQLPSLSRTDSSNDVVDTVSQVSARRRASRKRCGIM
jgi:hypothetical protein